MSGGNRNLVKNINAQHTYKWANGIFFYYIDKHGIFGVMLSSNSLISCSFTLAKRSAILYFCFTTNRIRSDSLLHVVEEPIKLHCVCVYNKVVYAEELFRHLNTFHWHLMETLVKHHFICFHFSVFSSFSQSLFSILFSTCKIYF